MKLIKEIRTALGLSQTEFADLVSVSFTAVNRWENGKAAPNSIAQERIFEIATEKSIPVDQMIHRRIQSEADQLSIDDGRLLLYHGSKSGIHGAIAPVSRDNCDFGKGFYMGTLPEQPLTLVCDFEKSKFYILSVSLSDMNCLSVEPNMDWAMLVAFHRGKMEGIQGTALYKKYQAMAENHDYLIGSIANDRMFYVLDNFFLGNITDTALVKSLKALQLGQQYVALTQKACDGIRIEKELPLTHLERRCLQEKAKAKRQEGISLANDICKTYRREGRFFDEILEQAKE